MNDNNTKPFRPNDRSQTNTATKAQQPTVVPFRLIEIADVTNADIWNPDRTNKKAYTKWDMNYAIDFATQQIDAMVGGILEQSLSGLNANQTRDIKYAGILQTVHLLNNGVELSRGSVSSSQGNYSFSITNPDDPAYWLPQAITLVKKSGLWKDNIYTSVGNGTPRKYNGQTQNNACAPYYGLNPVDFGTDANDQYLTLGVADNRYLPVQGTFYSSDLTINYPIAVVDPQTGRLKLNITANVPNILTALMNNPNYLQTIINTLLNKTNLVLLVGNDLANNQVFLNKFIPIVENWLLNNEQFAQAVAQATEDIISDDNVFMQILSDAIENLIANDTEFVQNLATQLVANQTFLTDVGAKLADNNTFISEVANQLGNKESFLNAIEFLIASDPNFVNQLTGNQAFVNSLADALKANTTFLTDLANAIATLIKQDPTLQALLKGEKGDKGDPGTPGAVQKVMVSNTPTDFGSYAISADWEPASGTVLLKAFPKMTTIYQSDFSKFGITWLNGGILFPYSNGFEEYWIFSTYVDENNNIGIDVSFHFFTTNPAKWNSNNIPYQAFHPLVTTTNGISLPSHKITATVSFVQDDANTEIFSMKIFDNDTSTYITTDQNNWTNLVIIAR